MATKKVRLLLLDANIVLELHRLDLWSGVVERCEVLLARTVLSESKYYDRKDGTRAPIMLDPAIAAGQIRMVEVALGTIDAFQQRFKHTFLERLDAGELESLAYLVEVNRDCRISSADKIVWRTLGVLKLGEQGISLEEVLQRIGLARRLNPRFTQQFRQDWTRRGFDEGMRGEALQSP